MTKQHTQHEQKYMLISTLWSWVRHTGQQSCFISKTLFRRKNNIWKKKNHRLRPANPLQTEYTFHFYYLLPYYVQCGEDVSH